MTERTPGRLYQQYLTLDRLYKATDKVGAVILSIEISQEVMYQSHKDVLTGTDVVPTWSDMYWGADITLALGYRYSATQEERERIANDLMNTLNGAYMVRDDGNMYIVGTNNGITYVIRAGSGMCVQVLVGERTVEKPDPNYKAPEAPMVKVTEPVY
jgi:hypothetical protein